MNPEANRKNALKSTGPKTPRGKSFSRSNALKHGLYSRELLVSETDKPDFQELYIGLAEELKPSTMLQRNAFENVVACHWRCKLAMRLEHRQFDLLLHDEQCENALITTGGHSLGPHRRQVSFFKPPLYSEGEWR